MNDKTLKNNLETLQKTVPQLYRWLISQPSDIDWCKLITSNNKLPNLLIKHGSKLDTAYSIEDPKKDIKNLIKDISLNKEDITILVGFGLGYTVKYMLNKLEKGHKIVVIEPVARMILLAFSMYNFEKYIQNGTLIIVAPGEQEIAMVIGFLDNAMVIENWYIIINKYTRMRPDEYSKLTKLTIELINQAKCNIGTVEGNGKQIADNDISNLPYVIRYRGVNELKDLYKGKPAVLVSTGPSLQKNIHELFEIKDKVIIIAVAQALRALLAYDIRPDFICSVDFGKVNISHLKGLMDSDVPFVVLNRTYAPILMSYKGPKFIVSSLSPGFDKTASGLITNRGSLDQGGSVAHLCFSLAYHLGCDPIMLLGQDLAYENDESHISLADTGGKLIKTPDGQLLWKVTDQRSHLHKDPYHSMGSPVNVPAYFGGAVKTNVGLASFITSFEAMAKKYKKNRTLYNCTEGGAKIKGFDHKLLKDAITLEYENKSTMPIIDKSIINPLLSLRDNINEEIEKAIPMLNNDIEVLENLIEECDQGHQSNVEITNIINKKEKNKKGQIDWTIQEKEKLKKLFAENRKHSKEAHEYAKKNPLIGLAIYASTRKISSRELNVKRSVKHVFSNAEDLKTRLKSNFMILEDAKEAAYSLIDSYEKARDLLIKFQETKDESLLLNLEPEKIDLNDAEEYFTNNNWAHPLLDARKVLKEGNEKVDDINKAKEIETKALEMKNKAIEKAKKIDKIYLSKVLEYNELIEKSRKIGKDKKFDEALELIKKAKDLLPNEIVARWGLATTYHHIKKYDESIKEYKELIDIFPDNLIFQFELGQVYLISGNSKEGFSLISKVMEKDSKYDSFLKHIGNLYMQKGKYKEAVIAFENYLKKFKADYDIWYNLSLCFKKLENEEESKKAFKISKNLKNIESDKINTSMLSLQRKMKKK